MSAAYDVAQYLASQGVGTFGGNSGWSINVSREPLSPDNSVTVYDTGGPGLDTDELDLDWVSFQVRVRAVNYLDGYQKQKTIRSLLMAGFVQDGTKYTVQQESNIMHIGRDENDRQLLTANYVAFAQSTG